jgi:hypothetical protein
VIGPPTHSKETDIHDARGFKPETLSSKRPPILAQKYKRRMVWVMGHISSSNSSKYRVIQEESAIFWEMIVCVILSKNVYINMCPIFDGYGVMGIL